MDKIKIFIVDDSAVVRQVLSEIFSSAPDIEVIGVAPDPILARAKMEKDWPDVIITDIEMPNMNGLDFLQKIMKEHPTPVIICSSVANEGGEYTIKGLSLGAVDIIEKPKIGVKDFLSDSETLLFDSVRAASQVNVSHMRKISQVKIEPKMSADVVIAPWTGGKENGVNNPVVVLGASAGGTQAIEAVLCALPKEVPPIAIVQHMPPNFTKAFANRLNGICKINVTEAVDGEIIEPGHAYIAQGGTHMLLNFIDNSYKLKIKDGPLVTRHRPSVDVLFRSASKCAGNNALGIILTGMGDDGALGMKEMHDRGIYTIAQDEKSCAVFGMPKEAIKHGGVDKIMSLDEIPDEIIKFYSRKYNA